MPQVMSGQDLHRALRRITHEILERHRGAEGLILMGIHTRGVPLAQALAALVSEFENVTVPVGELDVEAFRDDRAVRSVTGRPRSTRVPVAIDGADVIVVDDVLYTGRTVRAALDSLSELGRARSIELAVMVDRGHRELPIRADYVGKNLPTSRQERVWVKVETVDGVDGVWIERIAAA